MSLICIEMHAKNLMVYFVGGVRMDRIANIVFDEADTLFDDSFNELSNEILEKTKVNSVIY